MPLDGSPIDRARSDSYWAGASGVPDMAEDAENVDPETAGSAADGSEDEGSAAAGDRTEPREDEPGSDRTEPREDEAGGDRSGAQGADTEAGDRAAAQADDTVEGVLLAGEVASLVTATVSGSLWLDGSTTVEAPGGPLSALAITFWLLALTAAFAAGRARYRGASLRALGHSTVVAGLVVLAAAGSAPVVAAGNTVVTAGTIGVVVAVAGANLVAFDLVR